jgi:hypothetical protein
MKKRDFVDSDLGGGGRSADSELPLSSGMDEADDGTMAPISDLSIGRLAKYRQEVSTNMMDAVSELERLKIRRQLIEQKKSELEDLEKKQLDYERGKREMVGHLHEGVVVLEKKEVQTAQLSELVKATRDRVRDALDEIEAIDEDAWQDDRFREELYKALVIVDDARVEYNKALARIEVLEGSNEALLERTPAQSSMGTAVEQPTSFGYWVKVGFALTLPVVILAGLCLAVYLVLRATNYV